MIGIITSALVVIRADRCGRGKAVQPGNREWAIAIVYIHREGRRISPFLVVQGKCYLLSQYTKGGLPDNQVIKTTTNRQTNDETGLKQLKHFDKHTRSYAKGPYRMLVLDGHKSHELAVFQDYYKTNNIIPLCLPPYLFYLTQPLNIRCFSILKRIYRR